MAATCFNPANGGHSLPCDVSQGRGQVRTSLSTRSKTRVHVSVLQSNSMNSGARSSLNSPLVNYALSGLQRCWLPEHGRWSHIYHLDGRSEPNESLARSDVFYTLNVLLGFSRVNQAPVALMSSAMFYNCSDRLSRSMHLGWHCGRPLS
jgi:hypothetical protein